MTRRTIAMLGLVAGLSLACSGAQDYAERKAADEAVSVASGGQVQVDQSGNTMTVQGQNGTFTAGDGSTIPDGFPHDLAYPGGKVTSSISTTGSVAPGNVAYMVTFETKDKLADVKTFYVNALKSRNDATSADFTTTDGFTLAAAPADAKSQITVLSTSSSDTTSISVTVDAPK